MHNAKRCTAPLCTLGACMFILTGCQGIQWQDSPTRRAVTESARLVGVTYTALLTTIATHEAGHWEHDVLYGRHPDGLRLRHQFYRPWEIPHENWVGVDIRAPLERSRTFYTRGFAPPQVRWAEIHASLAGVAQTNRCAIAVHEALASEQLKGRWWHAYGLFLSLDTTIYAFRDYRNLHQPDGEPGDLVDYQLVMHAYEKDGKTLLRAGVADLLGKAPDFWWHARGVFGYTDPPPHLWHFGNFEIRPGIVVSDWRFGYGIVIEGSW